MQMYPFCDKVYDESEYSHWEERIEKEWGHIFRIG